MKSYYSEYMKYKKDYHTLKHTLTYKTALNQEGGELTKDKKEVNWPFRIMKNEKGEPLNIILISAPFRNDDMMKKGRGVFFARELYNGPWTVAGLFHGLPVMFYNIAG